MKVALKKHIDETNKWKVDYEDISTKKIQEIHSALKMLNQNIKNGQNDLKDTKDIISAELR